MVVVPQLFSMKHFGRWNESVEKERCQYRKPRVFTQKTSEKSGVQQCAVQFCTKNIESLVTVELRNT
jgi:hypothetical protein